MKNQKGMLKPSPLMRPNVSMVRPWSRGQRKRDGRSQSNDWVRDWRTKSNKRLKDLRTGVRDGRKKSE